MERWNVRLIAVAGVFLLGLLLETGTSAQVLKKTDALVAKAQAGDAVAQYDLGLIYETGEGVPQDYALAKGWYTKAAEQGFFKAQFEMGMLYAMGRFSQDLETAARESTRWFEMLDAKRVLVDQKYYIWRDRIERKKRLTTGSVRDMKERVDWLRKVGYVGHLQTHLYLGHLYSFSLPGPVEPNCQQAFFWYGKAASRGDAYAQQQKADLYVICPEIPTDYSKAARWYREAALQGDVTAQITLAGLYKKGKGVPQSPSKYAYWLAQAADQNNRVAQKSLGDCYRDGYGVPKDLTHAMGWYNLSAAQGYDRAQQELASMRGRSQDRESPDLIESVALLAFLWVALDAVSDGPETSAPASEHSSVVEEAVRKAVEECRQDVWRRMVRCYSYTTIDSCHMTGCDYEYTCQSSRGRGKCDPSYSNYAFDYYCDPKVGEEFDTKEEVLQHSCR